MIEPSIVCCPYCGENFETRVDCSAGEQSYIEDCYVCCQPIEFNLQTGATGELIRLDVKRGDE